MRTTIALDKDGDLLLGTHPSGHTSFAICAGAEMVVQAIKTGLAVSRGDLWFNLAYGIDKQMLFYNTDQTEDFLAPMRALAFKEFLQSFEDVERVDGEALFTRVGRTVSVVAPCVILTCEASTQRVELGELNVC